MIRFRILDYNMRSGLQPEQGKIFSRYPKRDIFLQEDLSA
jgi:hypothetical protein